MLKIHFPFFEVELVTVLLILRVFFSAFVRDFYRRIIRIKSLQAGCRGVLQCYYEYLLFITLAYIQFIKRHM